MKILTFLAAVLLLPACVLAATPKTTDTVKLKDGTVLEGKIISESPENLVIKVAIGKGIMDEKTVPAAQVASVEKAAPEAIAFERLGKILPTGDLMTTQEYDELIATKIEPFLKNHGKTTLAGEVRKIADTLNEEKARVANGDIKLNGEWIAAADYQKDKLWMDAKVALHKMQTAATARRYADVFKAFDEIEKTWPATTVVSDGAQIARKALATYKADLSQALAVLPAYEKQRKERLASLLPEDRAQTEAAWQKERDAIKAKVAEETKANLKWFTVDRLSEDSLKKMIAQIEKEDSRIAALPTQDYAANEAAIKEVEKALNDGKPEVAGDLLSKIKSDIQRMPYFKVLGDRQRADAQRKRTEEMAAKRAEVEKTAAAEAEQRKKKAEEERKAKEKELREAHSPISTGLSEAGANAKKKAKGLSPILVAIAVLLGGTVLALVISPMLRKKEDPGSVIERKPNKPQE